MTLTNAPAGSEMLFLESLAAFLTIATIWFVLKFVGPDDFASPQTLLIVLFVIVPFVMLIYFGVATMICTQMVTRSGRPMSLLEPSLWKILPATVTYIGVSAWVWLRWRKSRNGNTTVKRGRLP
jgi:glucan phosphoethanolaminetransferase (alkaline phosphatase superfamily)